MIKLKYQPVAIQDECFGGTEKNPEIIVIVKLEAQGAKIKHYKNDVISFQNVHYLDKYLSENNLIVLKESKFKPTVISKTLQLIRANKKAN